MVNLRSILLLLLNLSPLLCVKTKVECGYKQCPQSREGALNVHLIPHSHMDAGWVKTFDEYYYGTKTSVSSANVQLIYHSVLSELLHDKRRKFTFSETAYFWRWWKEQRPATRATFRSLVQEGRAEFAGGSWTHADAATVSYSQVLDLWTWGLRKLNDTLGPCGKPKAAWQIDNYGHSREIASLLAQMGFDGMFVGRVDYHEREAMMEEDRMEYMWRGSDVLGKMSDIMTHTLFNLYNAPNGFCFDWLCTDEPVVDDADSPAYNADTRVNEFIVQIERQAKYYDHDNILVTMGGDFTYQNAANWFMNMDKLINHVNTHPANMSDINIFYSTPSCYLKAIYLYGRRDKAIYTEKRDHLPYGSDPATYWTGFYTSRPSLKFFAKRAHAFLQVVKQLSVITRTGDSYELHLLRHAVALILHHDAITGTSQQHVANDFVRTLSEAVDICTKKVSNLLSILTPTWGGKRRSKNSQQFVACHQLNISQCRFTESQESMLLLIYNPLSVKTYHFVRLPAIALHYSIRDYNDEEVEYQLLPIPAATINLPGRGSNAIQELWFEAENIPPLGYSAYSISALRDPLEENNFRKSSQNTATVEQEMLPYISNEYLKVTIDKSTGLLESITHVDGTRILVSQNFHFYPQRQGAQSGAYSFRTQQPRPTQVTDKVQFNTINGALVKEIRQRFTDWISQVIRIHRGEEFVELQWTVGPVPIGTDLGKEVVSIFKTNISNAGEFHTDSNGRQMMKRTCWNETTSHQQKKPVPACYYPVTSRICVKALNSSAEMCVLTDRPQGGTSYDDGELELMVHRRLLTDDGFGLEEPLNEEAFGAGLVVKGTHRIYLGSFAQEVDDLTFTERMSQAARRWDMEPWMFFTSGDKGSRRKWQNVRNKRYSSIRVPALPAHIHILTLEPWKAGSVLLRLENTLESANRGGLKRNQDTPEDPKAHITVELRKIFLQHKVRLVRETTLAANQWLDDARQMDWSTRYVYKGGDDGMLLEDTPEDDDRSARHIEPKDSAHYSDEEPEYPRKFERQRTEKTKTKIKSDKTYIYDRKKRALNESDINENIINDTVNKFILDLKINDSLKNITGKISATTDMYDMYVMTGTEKYNVKNNQHKNIRKQPRLRFLNKPKPRIPFWEKDEEEIRSSEEDFSSNLRRRSPQKKKRRNSKKNKDEVVYENSDDGITKSMYEMYYKPLPKNPYKTSKHPEESRIRKKKTRRIEYSDEETAEPARRRRRNKKKRFNADMPLSIADRRVKQRGIEHGRERMEKESGKSVEKERDRDVLEGEDDMPIYEDSSSPRKRRGTSSSEGRWSDHQNGDDDNEEDDEYDEEQKRRIRRKRMLPKEELEQNTSEADQGEPDYVVTLRPTQIRTFVVWFENTK